MIWGFLQDFAPQPLGLGKSALLHCHTGQEIQLVWVLGQFAAGRQQGLRVPKPSGPR